MDIEPLEYVKDKNLKDNLQALACQPPWQGKPEDNKVVAEVEAIHEFYNGGEALVELADDVVVMVLPDLMHSVSNDDARVAPPMV